MTTHHQPHRAGLRAFPPLLFHEGHFRPDLQAVKVIVQDTVPMEIDLPAVRRFEETIILGREKLAHPAVRRNFVYLHFPAPAAGVILQPPAASPCSGPTRNWPSPSARCVPPVSCWGLGCSYCCTARCVPSAGLR